MSRIIFCLAALSLFAATTASANSYFAADVHIISVDAAKKTIRLSFADGKTLDGKEVVATWDASTEWWDDQSDGTGDMLHKKLDSTAAATLKNHSQVYVGIDDRNSHGTTWWIDKVSIEK